MAELSESPGLVEELHATARRGQSSFLLPCSCPVQTLLIANCIFSCQSLASLSQRAAERPRGVPATDGRLEQFKSQVVELEAQDRLLEKQRAETEEELMKE